MEPTPGLCSGWSLGSGISKEVRVAGVKQVLWETCQARTVRQWEWFDYLVSWMSLDGLVSFCCGKILDKKHVLAGRSQFILDHSVGIQPAGEAGVTHIWANSEVEEEELSVPSTLPLFSQYQTQSMGKCSWNPPPSHLCLETPSQILKLKVTCHREGEDFCLCQNSKPSLIEEPENLFFSFLKLSTRGQDKRHLFKNANVSSNLERENLGKGVIQSAF